MYVPYVQVCKQQEQGLRGERERGESSVAGRRATAELRGRGRFFALFLAGLIRAAATEE